MVIIGMGGGGGSVRGCMICESVLSVRVLWVSLDLSR